MVLDTATFLALALACSPAVAPDTLLAIAQHESGLRPWVVHDNVTGQVHHARDLEHGAAVATSLIASGHSLDIGLMQLNSQTLKSLGLDVTAAFNPCTNVRAAGMVLAEAYKTTSARLPPGSAALRAALSRYNTGDDAAGLANGYVGRVEKHAPTYVVPSLAPTMRADDSAGPPLPRRARERGDGREQLDTAADVGARGAVTGVAAASDAFARRPRHSFVERGGQ